MVETDSRAMSIGQHPTVAAVASQTMAMPAAGQTNPTFSGSTTMVRPSRQAPTYAVSQSTVPDDACTLERVRSPVLTGSVSSERTRAGSGTAELTRWSHEPTALLPTRSGRSVRLAGSCDCSERRGAGPQASAAYVVHDHRAELPGSARGIAHRSGAALLREPQPFARRACSSPTRCRRCPASSRAGSCWVASTSTHRPRSPRRCRSLRCRWWCSWRRDGRCRCSRTARSARGAAPGDQPGAAAADRQRVHRSPPAALGQRVGRRGDRRGAARPALRPSPGRPGAR